MRYCYHCNRITTGEPMFCNFCGRSYDIKLCSRLHPNPRTAEVCSQCGSRDLSQPQPRVPFWSQPLLLLLSKLPGIVLLLLSVALFVALLHSLLTDPNMQGMLFVLGFVLALLWFLYLQLPGFLRRGIGRLLGRSKRNGHSDHR